MVTRGRGEYAKVNMAKEWKLDLDACKTRSYVSYSFGVYFPLVTFLDRTQKKVNLGDYYLGERTGPGSRATGTGAGASTQRTSL